MPNKYTYPMAFLLVLACSPAGHSAIIGTAGQIQLISRPESVLNDDLISDATAVAFDELQFVTLSESVPVDIAGPGTYSNANPPGVSSAAIPQGTLVHSYYLHADSVSGAAGSPVLFDGTITFDSRILGIQVLSATLDSGIDPLGAFDLSYPFTVGRSGLEFEPTGGGSGLDTIALSADRHTITVHLQTTGQTDQVRIITAVPEPSSLVLIGIGAFSLIGWPPVRRWLSRSRCRWIIYACHMVAAFVVVVGAIPPAAKADFVYTHVGDADPATEGFTGIHIFGAPSTFGPIANDLGNPAWSITGTGQSSQHAFASGPLSASELTDIATQGFTLTMVARAVQGIAPAYSAAQPVGIAGALLNTGTQRFDVSLGLDANGDTVVFLPTSVDADGPGSSEQGWGPSYTLVGSGSSYHAYSLVYDPTTQLADLYVDGVSRIQDYAGNTTFITNGGLAFGAASGGQANHTFVQVVSVPEPSSLAMIVIGGLGLVVNRRYCRRRRRRLAGDARR